MEMKTNQRKRLICALTCAVLFIETIIIGGFLVLDMGDSDPFIQRTDIIWVDFNVTGTLRVEVENTNCGEVPDEAWEEARRLLSKCEELKDIKFETAGHTLIESGNNPIERTNTDANTYMVTVTGKVRGDNTEEAKEHF